MKRFADSLHSLKSSCPELEISTDDRSLSEHGHDWWMRSLLQRRRGEKQAAAAVVRPADTNQVGAVLAWAQAERVAVVPFGLGSGVCGGILPGPGQVVVDMTKMASILAIDDAALLVTVQPGMRGSVFEESLQKRGYTMGHFPQSIELSTVGGWCATRAAGQFSTLYGNVEDMLVGCEFVLPGGRVVRVPANPRSSTGPDLLQLFLGSEGTLGIFTELTFRIHPVAEARRAGCFTLASVEAGVEALRMIMRNGWTPAVTRLYDATEAGRNFAVASAGCPVLLLLSEGSSERTGVEFAAIERIVAEHGGTAVGSEPVDSWLVHRNSVPSFESLLDQGLVVDTIEVAIGWGGVSELFERVTSEGSKIDGMIAMSGHISHCYTQGANIYFTFVAVQSDLDAALAIYDRAWELTMRITHEMGGTIAHHHGIGRVRKSWLQRELGTGHELLREIKRALDPVGVMNPGALVDPA